MKYIKHIILTAMAVVVMTGAWAQTSPEKQPDGSWMFTMPNANQLLEVEYEPWTLTLSHNAGHGTVELLRPGSSVAVGTDENAFQYCYDCQRSPAYPTVANNGHNYLSGFTNPKVGLNGVGVTNNPNGPWKLEYVGKYSHSEYNFSVSGVRHTYGLNSDEDVPIFLLYQWSSTTNQYEPVVYGVACAYSKLNNTHGDDHTLLFVAEGHWGCFLSNNQHSENLNIYFSEDLSTGMHDFAEAATPALPDGVVDNGNGTYSVTPGTTVTIEAIANTAEHYYFNNWTNEANEVYSGSGVVTPSGAKPATSLLTFTVTGDTTVRGNFKIDTYTLRVNPNSISMGHVGIGETVYTSEYKDTVMTDRQHIDVTAIPEPGHYFVNWTNIHGDTVSTSITLNYQATSDTTFTANFAEYAFLEVASNNTDWGTVGEPQVGAGNTDHVMTLYDESESTSNHMVPAYTCWFDALTKSQYVIPASKMADAKGGTITSIKYYLQDPTTWTSDVDVEVYLKEVTYSTLSNMVDKSSCTGVYSGQLHFENKGVTIIFTNPYTYNGGNLLVGLENTSAGQYYCGIQFLGEDAPGASMSGHSGNFQQQDFLPQCTFTYQPSGVKVNPNGGYYIIPGNEVTVTATPETGHQFVKWTDENNNVMGTDAQLTFTITGDTTAMANFDGEEYRLDSVRTTWDVYINGAQTPIHSIAYSANDTMGYVMIPVNANVMITPQPEAQAMKVSKLELIEQVVTPSVPAGAINGKFTINADGDQVYFSQGNLQYQASTGTWRFAEHQYDYIGSDNASMSETYSGWIDLYRWGTSGIDYTEHATKYWPWETSFDPAEFNPYSSLTTNLYDGDGDNAGKADWGYNAISNGGNTQNSGWRTLKNNTTDNEWQYIFNSRSTANEINSTSNARYTQATINTDGTPVNGIILFPDESIGTTPSGVTWDAINAASAWGTQCTTAGWAALEAAGCVFLPASGKVEMFGGVSMVGSEGHYWSSSYNSNYYSYGMYFYGSNVSPQYSDYRNYGLSVRLVKDAE